MQTDRSIEQLNKTTMTVPYGKFLTALFYGSLVLAASLGLTLLFYWGLSRDSSIYSLINNTKSEPVYLWSYAILTFGTLILFGVNAALLVYRWRKYGPPRFTGQAGSGLGTLVGFAASACPVCGSVLLSVVGIAGGLAAFPLQGLELKALSFGFIALPVWLTARELQNPRCGPQGCPAPRDATFKKGDWLWLIGSTALILIFVLIGWQMLKFDIL